MAKLKNLTIYNPATLSETDFLNSFVARNELYKNLLSKFSDIEPGNLVNHHLIVGQRGMGKTSLLRRLSIGVDQDQTLNKILLPLTFREEQYNVHNMQSFWANCLDALGDYFEKNGMLEKADLVDNIVLKLDRADADGDTTFAEFKKLLQIEDKRPILFLDNIDIIFDGLREDQWSLRRALQEAGGIVVVGAATSYMEAVSDKRAAFYDFFQVTLLEKLSQDDLLICLKRLALARGQDGKSVAKVIEEDPGRIRTLYDLTGGNPRTLTLLYLLLEMDSQSDVFGDLERLLDQVTVLYKARVEDLSSQARIVVDAVALAWDPQTVSELSRITNLSSSTISTHLNRLSQDGLIEKVSISKSKKSAYQIGERFFNIWYLMRHAPRRQRTRLKWLTGFLRSFYTPIQLTTRAKFLLKRASDNPKERYDYCLALSGAVEDQGWQNLLGSEALNLLEGDNDLQVYEAKIAESDKTRVPKPETIDEWIIQGRLLSMELDRYEDAKQSFFNAIEMDKTNSLPWLELGDLYRLKLEDYQEARKAFEKALELEPKSAPAMIGLGRVLSFNLEQPKRAKNYLVRASKIDPNNDKIYGILGDIYYFDLEEIELAEKSYLQALEINPKYYRCWQVLGLIYQFEKEAIDQAKSSFEKALEINSESVFAIYRLGFLYHHELEDIENAVELYSRAIDLNPEFVSPYYSLFDLYLIEMNDQKMAEKTIRSLVSTLPNDARAKLTLARFLQYEHEKYDEAEEILLELIKSDPTNYNAFICLGDLYHDAGKLFEAKNYFEKAISAEPENTRGLKRLANLLETGIRNFSDAEAVYRRILEINKDIGVTVSLANLLQNHLGKSIEAYSLYGKVLEMKPSSAEDYCHQGYLQCYLYGKFKESRDLYQSALEKKPEDLVVRTNIAVLNILSDYFKHASNAEEFNSLLDDHSKTGQALIVALKKLQEDNLGDAINQFDRALRQNDIEAFYTYQGIFVLFCRILVEKGFGERLLTHFVEEGLSDQYWPVYAALNAFIFGENRLLDVNPEVRGVAEHILNWLRFGP